MTKLNNISPFVACVWDFDNTLISGYMEEPLFEAYGIDSKTFWKEVNALPEVYAQKGIRVSKDSTYLNHLLTYVQNGPLKGLSNKDLKEFGKLIQFYDGLPQFFKELKDLVHSKPKYTQHDIQLEHYIVSAGLKQMITGSAIAEFVDGIYGCEFIEHPMLPGYLNQKELSLEMPHHGIQQVGLIIDNTLKTRFIFEINKGVNKNEHLDVNSSMQDEDRRIPFKNMIYIADGPSDIPSFSVVKNEGGKAFAVYNPDSQKEFEQNDKLLQANRIHCYGPANYTALSPTAQWLKMHVLKICDRIVEECEATFKQRVTPPPAHIHEEKVTDSVKALAQSTFLGTQ